MSEKRINVQVIDPITGTILYIYDIEPSYIGEPLLAYVFVRPISTPDNILDLLGLEIALGSYSSGQAHSDQMDTLVMADKQLCLIQCLICLRSEDDDFQGLSLPATTTIEGLKLSPTPAVIFDGS